ncbi:patched domain-containing protein 3-like [Saccopteryx leptura]|uniref:patched domain-containing protein 3-like n=1 Tax=Saccopteryx leptura TaxID=249018 RepID=UPI00339C8051
MSLSPSQAVPEAQTEPSAGREAESTPECPKPAGPGPDSDVGSGQEQEPEQSPASGPHPEPPGSPEQGSHSGPGSGQGDPSPPASQPLVGVSHGNRCLTNCVEAPLSRAFQRLGWGVGSHPWVFLLMSVLLTVLLSTGFMYLPEDKEVNVEEEYTPIRSRAKLERRFVQEHFTLDDRDHFSVSRKSTEIHFASLLVVANTASLLEQEVFSEVSTLDQAVQALEVNGTQTLYHQVCARNQGFCVPSNPLLSTWQVNKNLDFTGITFPIYTVSGRPVSLAGTLGGIVLGTRQLVLQAKAMRLQYYLKTGGEDDKRSKTWLLHFLSQVGDIEESLPLKMVQVTYFTSLSRGVEFETSSKTVIPLFYVAFILIVLFAIISCYSLTLFIHVHCCSRRRQVTKLYRVILLTVLAFLLLGLPFSLFLHLLAALNSAVNPVIYFFVGKQGQRPGRRALRELLQSALTEDTS